MYSGVDIFGNEEVCERVDGEGELARQRNKKA